jgi:hypothetical protein
MNLITNPAVARKRYLDFLFLVIRLISLCGPRREPFSFSEDHG